jgi:membrane protease YdiL (CAAX protease family)
MSENDSLPQHQMPPALPEVPPAPERSPLFFGPNGLRAGWGILLFALMLGTIFIGGSAFVQIQHMAHPASPPPSALFSPALQLAEDILYILAVIFAAILLGRGGVFSAGKTALTGILLLASVLIITLAIVHVTQVQKQEAAAKGQAQTKTSPPSSAAAANPKSQEWRAIVSEAFTFGAVLLITWIMSRVEHRRFGEYGFGGNKRRWPQLAQGLFSGFAALSLLIAGLYFGHWITFNGLLLHGAGPILSNGIMWLVAFIFVGFFEEFFFRGYLQFTLARGIGFGAIGFFAAAALFNFSFGFVHGGNPGESPIGLFTAGLIGFVFCISLWYTRSLWWAVGFHATWDWGESFFYGTADSGGVSQGRLLDTHPQGKLLLSGGATGPEGSALCLGIIVLIAIWVWFSLRKERAKSTNQSLVNPLESNPL